MNTTDEEFREIVWCRGNELFRPMPWREKPTLYNVLVSELMLQQTQVDRVIPKFEAWLERFPDFTTLAQASVAEVLTEWQGLGYNRRAKFLLDAARVVRNGQLPVTLEQLVALPGVGKNTAGAIMNYCYETATPFVETNIRTVYFYHFFHDAQAVSDAEILQKVEATMDREQPREWFWALMDYGSHLKKTGTANIHQSRHYKKQSPLEGSVRQTRGRIIAALTKGPMDAAKLAEEVGDDHRFEPALKALVKEGLISCIRGRYDLTK